MEPDPREPTGDLGYDMAHEVTGRRPRPQEGAAEATPGDVTGDAGTGDAETEDSGTGDYAYDEAHDFRR